MLSNGVEENNQLQFFKALKSSFLLIFLAMIVYRVFDQYLTKQIEIIIRSQDGVSPTIWFWGALSLLVSIFFPTLVAIVSLYALRFNSVKNISAFLREHFELSILETLRAWGYSFLWGLLLIIPGLIKMSFYYLTIFVVLFNRDYAEGKVDALTKSAEISKAHWTKLNLLVTLFYMVIPMIGSIILDEYTLFEKFPLYALAYTAIESVFLLAFHYFVLNLFKNYFLPQGEFHVAHV